MHTIENHIDIHAKPSAVIAALTTEQGIRGWFTDDATVSTNEATYRFARPDGAREVAFRVDHASDAGVAMTCVRESNNPDWLGTKLSFAVSTKGDVSRVALVHSGYPSRNENYDQCTRGWAHFLGSLKQYLETGTGVPFARTYEIVQELDIAGDPERIFAAVTTAKGVAAWWTRDCEITPTQHSYSFKDMSARFLVERVDPASVVLRCVEDSGMGGWLGSTLAYTLAPAGRSTHVTLSHTGIQNEECQRTCTRGWTFFMASLKNLIERGEGTPFPTEIR